MACTTCYSNTKTSGISGTCPEGYYDDEMGNCRSLGYKPRYINPEAINLPYLTNATETTNLFDTMTIGIGIGLIALMMAFIYSSKRRR